MDDPKTLYNVAPYSTLIALAERLAESDGEVEVRFGAHSLVVRKGTPDLAGEGSVADLDVISRIFAAAEHIEETDDPSRMHWERFAQSRLVSRVLNPLAYLASGECHLGRHAGIECTDDSSCECHIYTSVLRHIPRPKDHFYDFDREE